MSGMPPEYWGVDIAGRGRVYVKPEDMPAQLLPSWKGPPPENVYTMIWLRDVTGGPVGFPFDALNCVEWFDVDVLANNDKLVGDDDGEGWKR